MSQGTAESVVVRPNSGRELQLLALAGVLLLTGAFWLFLSGDRFFVFDDWSWWQSRVDSDVPGRFLEPHALSPHVGLFLGWNALTAVFGMDFTPYLSYSFFLWCLAIVGYWSLSRVLGWRGLPAAGLALAFAFIPPAVTGTHGFSGAWMGSAAAFVWSISLLLRFKTPLAVLAILVSVFFGPPGIAFWFAFAVLALLLRNRWGVVGSMLVGAIYLLWRAYYGSDSMDTDPSQTLMEPFSAAVLLDPRVWLYVVEGVLNVPLAAFGWRTLGMVTAAILIATGWLVSRLLRRQDPPQESRVRVMSLPNPWMLPFAALAGLLGWFLSLALVRIDLAQEYPQWFGPLATRYQFVALVMAFVGITGLLHRFALPIWAGSGVVVIMLASSVAFGLEWEDREGSLANGSVNGLCESVGEFGLPVTQARLTELERYGYLTCS